MDIVECEMVVQRGNIGEPPAEAVECLADDDIETPLAGGDQQLLVIRPHGAAAA